MLTKQLENDAGVELPKSAVPVTATGGRLKKKLLRYGHAPTRQSFTKPLLIGAFIR